MCGDWCGRKRDAMDPSKGGTDRRTDRPKSSTLYPYASRGITDFHDIVTRLPVQQLTSSELTFNCRVKSCIYVQLLADSAWFACSSHETVCKSLISTPPSDLSKSCANRKSVKLQNIASDYGNKLDDSPIHIILWHSKTVKPHHELTSSESTFKFRVYCSSQGTSVCRSESCTTKIHKQRYGRVDTYIQ